MESIPDPEEYVRVARTDEVPDDKGLPIAIGKREAALFRVGDEFFAIKDVCPHLGSSLHRGFILEGKIVACADHGWTFRLEDGESPNRPDCRVPCFDVKVVGEDIYVSRRYSG